jgi:hypothetical protein
MFITLSNSLWKGEDGMHDWRFALLYQSHLQLDLFCYGLQPLSLYFEYRKLLLYPEGNKTGAGTYLSLYLMLGDSEILPPNRKLYAKCKLRIRDQLNSNHLEKTGLFS